MLKMFMGSRGAARVGVESINVQFRVRYDRSSEEETVSILGNIPQLGENAVDKAIPMDYDAESGLWTFSCQIEKGTKFHYRYVVRNTSNGSEFSESGIYRGLTLGIEELSKFPKELRIEDKWQRYEKSQKVLPEESNNTCTIVTQSQVGPGDAQVDELFANRSEANAESSFFNSMLKEKVDSMTEELQNQNTRLTKEVQEMREKIKSFKSVEEECLRVKLENAQMQADAAEQEKKDQKKIKELEASKADLEKRLNDAENELQATRENVHQVSTQSRIAKAREESAVSNSETELAKVRAEVFVKDSTISSLENQLEDLRERNVDLEKENHRHLADVWKSRDAVQQIKKQLQEAETKLSGCNHELHHRNSQYRRLELDLQRQSEAAKRQENSLREEIQKNKDALNKANAQLQERDDTISTLREEIRQLKTDIKTQDRRTTLSRFSLGTSLREAQLDDNENEAESSEDLLLKVAGKDLGGGRCLPDAEKLQELLDADARAEQNSLALEESKKELESSKKALEEMKEKVSSLEDELQSWKDKYAKIQLENRQLFNQVLELKGNIRVFARVRPMLSKEQTEDEECPSIIAPESDSVVVHEKQTHHDGSSEERKTYRFDRVFGSQSTQEEVYDEVQGLVRSVVDGYTVCIFAYGQTGSGKTYTMQGTETEPGINSRALKDLFTLIENRSDVNSFEVSASMLEIYNESIYDLLAGSRPTEGNNSLTLRQHPKRGAYVEGLSSQKVEKLDDIEQVMETARKHRSVTTTSMNDVSSRSHMIMQVHVKGHNAVTGKTTHSTMYLVDLAGSERLKRSEADGKALKEAQHINKSLSALGNVMSSLQSHSSHIPYRDSKLTHLLMNALGGPNKALMVVQLSPTAESVQESVCSLNFASRTAKVELGRAVNGNELNSVSTSKLSKEVQTLRQKLSEAAEKEREARVSEKSAREKYEAQRAGIERERAAWSSERARLECEVQDLRHKLGKPGGDSSQASSGLGEQGQPKRSKTDHAPPRTPQTTSAKSSSSRFATCPSSSKRTRAAVSQYSQYNLRTPRSVKRKDEASTALKTSDVGNRPGRTATPRDKVTSTSRQPNPKRPPSSHGPSRRGDTSTLVKETAAMSSRKAAVKSSRTKEDSSRTKRMRTENEASTTASAQHDADQEAKTATVSNEEGKEATVNTTKRSESFAGDSDEGGDENHGPEDIKLITIEDGTSAKRYLTYDESRMQYQSPSTGKWRPGNQGRLPASPVEDQQEGAESSVPVDQL
eukprot:gb/GECG01010311.1/.p1 GENE.gb/GECG01010311.1/~~gb/GECG01010311.1/.p1  ORF type:complete len:1253 (+),score=239.78 gb/GECG01010311.1/:1-3759(+)